MTRRADAALIAATGVCVSGLALVAGAVSFDHMRELATYHGQLGWKSYAFPVSVDGLEVVASLYLVSRRRTQRPTGWIPWTALIIGTAASLAANIAVGGTDLVGKALAGWPAVAMLVSIKLLFSMFESHPQPDSSSNAGSRPPAGSRRDHVPDEDAVLDEKRSVPDGRLAVPDGRTSSGTTPVQDDAVAVTMLLPAARAARAALSQDGQTLSRDALAATMRRAGHSVSNATASLLLHHLRTPEPPG